MTPIQQTAHAALSRRQHNSIRALQAKVEKPNAYATVKVSAAQFKAMQQAYNAVVAAGHTIPPEALQAAKNIGLA